MLPHFLIAASVDRTNGRRQLALSVLAEMAGGNVHQDTAIITCKSWLGA